MTREIKTWLSDSRVCNNSVVDHRSRRPVLSLRRNCVDGCHVSKEISKSIRIAHNNQESQCADHIGRRDASHGSGCSKTSAYRLRRSIWMGFDG